MKHIITVTPKELVMLRTAVEIRALSWEDQINTHGASAFEKKEHADWQKLLDKLYGIKEGAK